MTVNESTVLILQYVALAGAIFIQQNKNSGAPYLRICLFFNLPSPSKKVDEKKIRKERVKEYKERKRRKMRQKTENKKERERRLKLSNERER